VVANPNTPIAADRPHLTLASVAGLAANRAPIEAAMARTSTPADSGNPKAACAAVSGLVNQIANVVAESSNTVSVWAILMPGTGNTAQT